MLTADGRFAGLRKLTHTPGTPIPRWDLGKALDVVDIQSGQVITTFQDVSDWAVLAHHAQTGAFAMAAGDTVQVWTPPGNITRFSLPDRGSNAIRFSDDGRRLTVITEHHFTKKTRKRLKRPIVTALTWTLATGTLRSKRRVKPRRRFRWTEHDPSRAVAPVLKVARKTGRVGRWQQAPRGALIAIFIDDDLTIWDRKQRTQISLLAGQAHPSNRIVAMSQTSDQVAVGGRDGSIRIYRTDQPMRRLGAHPPYIRSLAFSPDGKWLASGGHTHWAVWDLATGARVHAGTGSVYSIAFDAKSSVLAVESSGIQLWQVDGWRKLKTMKGAATVYTAPQGILLAAYDPWGDDGIPAPLRMLTAPAWTPRPFRPEGVHDPGLAVGPHGWVARLDWTEEAGSQVHLRHPASGAVQTLQGEHTPNQSTKGYVAFGDGGKGLVALDAGGGVTYWHIDAAP